MYRGATIGRMVNSLATPITNEHLFKIAPITDALLSKQHKAKFTQLMVTYNCTDSNSFPCVRSLYLAAAGVKLTSLLPSSLYTPKTRPFWKRIHQQKPPRTANNSPSVNSYNKISHLNVQRFSRDWNIVLEMPFCCQVRTDLRGWGCIWDTVGGLFVWECVRFRTAPVLDVKLIFLTARWCGKLWRCLLGEFYKRWREWYWCEVWCWSWGWWAEAESWFDRKCYF